MLSIFYGTDTVGVRAKAHAHIDAHASNSTETIAPEHYAPGLFVSLGGSPSLFGENTVYIIDTPSEDEAMFSEFIESAELLARSPHTFVGIENTLSADVVSKLRKNAELTQVKTTIKNAFNIFSLADALQKKDKKMLWILLTAAWRNGYSTEEIIGTLFWQLKMIRLAAHTASAEESGQKPFVYQKAKRALTTYTLPGTEKLSESLIELYHAGHAGERDISIALEQWVLSI